MRERRHLPWVAALWLISQCATLAVAPLAMCCEHEHMTASDMHACCRGLPAGVPCPRHGHAPHQADSQAAHHQHESVPQPSGLSDADGAALPDDTPDLRCLCRASDAALAAVLIGQGILADAVWLPPQPRVAHTFTPRPTFVTTIPLLDTPPPRL